MQAILQKNEIGTNKMFFRFLYVNRRFSPEIKRIIDFFWGSLGFPFVRDVVDDIAGDGDVVDRSLVGSARDPLASVPWFPWVPMGSLWPDLARKSGFPLSSVRSFGSLGLPWVPFRAGRRRRHRWRW